MKTYVILIYIVLFPLGLIAQNKHTRPDFSHPKTGILVMPINDFTMHGLTLDSTFANFRFAMLDLGIKTILKQNDAPNRFVLLDKETTEIPINSYIEIELHKITTEYGYNTTFPHPSTYTRKDKNGTVRTGSTRALHELKIVRLEGYIKFFDYTTGEIYLRRRITSTGTDSNSRWVITGDKEVIPHSYGGPNPAVDVAVKPRTKLKRSEIKHASALHEAMYHFSTQALDWILNGFIKPELRRKAREDAYKKKFGNDN